MVTYKAYEGKENQDSEYNDIHNEHVELGNKVPPPVPNSAQGNTQNPMTASPQKTNENSLGYFAKIPIPISIIISVTALWLSAGSVLDILISGPDLADFVIDCYFVLFGVGLLLIKMPTTFSFMKCLESSRSGMEKWARFIATNWGQG